MPFILILLSLIAFALSGQDSSRVNVHLFPTDSSHATFQFTFTVDAEGENAIGKTIFENTISLSLVDATADTLLISITADSTRISNPSILTDGDAAIICAIIGVDMLIKCTTHGQLVEILNKEAMLKEFKGALTGLSAQRKDELVQGMLDEDEALLFGKMFELNYAGLLKFIRKDVQLPYAHTRDSIIQGTSTTAQAVMKTDESNTRHVDHFSIEKTMTQHTGRFTHTEMDYDLTYKPSVSTSREIATTDLTGLVISCSFEIVTKSEGSTMSSQGKIIHEQKPFSTWSSWTYKRL